MDAIYLKKKTGEETVLYKTINSEMSNFALANEPTETTDPLYLSISHGMNPGLT